MAKKGEVYAHHFSHDVDATCSGESLVHKVAKAILKHRLTSNLEHGLETSIRWDCDVCLGVHRENLANEGWEVVEERNLGPCQPDLTLVSRSDDVLGIMEVVHTHEPERHVYDFAHGKEIPLFEFKINSVDDLWKLYRDTPLTASKVNRCTREPRAPDNSTKRGIRNPYDPGIKRPCSECGAPTVGRVLDVATAPCQHCGEIMTLCRLNFGGMLRAPDEFEDRDVRVARSLGGILDFVFDRTTGAFCQANVCGQCKRPHLPFHPADDQAFQQEIDEHELEHLCVACRSVAQ